MRVFLNVFKRVATTCLCLLLLPVSAFTHEPPPLTLAADYQPGIDLDDYWVSEKLDGVRAYWDGLRLISRSGNPIHAPEWFTSGFPKTVLDGELWIGRQRFDEVSGIVRRHQPREEDWREVRFMLFDLPHFPGTFDERLTELHSLVSRAEIPWLQAIPQFRVASHEALLQELTDVTAEGSEGLMLHRGSSTYHSIRSADLLKLKALADAEATVISHIPGQGRLTGMMGSIVVETDDGIRFRIGTGFSDAERRDPPTPGSRITYQYSGTTARGVPRFARFLRVRHDP